LLEEEVTFHPKMVPFCFSPRKSKPYKRLPGGDLATLAEEDDDDGEIGTITVDGWEEEDYAPQKHVREKLVKDGLKCR